jgi:MFS family permease
MFTAYILAGRLFPNFSFKYGVALFFSIAPGVMLFSTWEVSARGLFIVLLPLFIYLLLSEIQVLKKILLLILLFVFQFAVHHYGFVLIPIICIYIGIIVLEKTSYLKKLNPYSHYLIAFLIIAFIVYPFLTRSLIDSGSRYSWLITSALTIIRQVGPVVILAAGSLFYLLLKKEKSRNDLLLLSMLTLFIPTIYSHTYGAFMLLLFIVLFIGVAFANITSMLENKRHVSVVLISIILFSTIFASYYNHNRTGVSDAYWYMGQDTHAAGMWGRNYIPPNSYGLDTAFETGRMFAISEGHPITPTHSAANLAYGFINESSIEYVQVSYLDKTFYFEGPYIVKSGTTVAGRMEWLRQTARTVEDLNGFPYFVQDNYYFKPVVRVVSESYNKIYENPRITIWHYDR